MTPTNPQIVRWSRTNPHKDIPIPSFLKRLGKTFLILIGSSLFFMFQSCSKEHIVESTPLRTSSLSIMESELIHIVNDYRFGIGLRPLEFSDIAHHYAAVHTDYMISKGKISHDNFPARANAISQETPVKFVAENVASGYDTAQEAFEYWHASDAHRASLEGDYSHTGVSISKDANGKYFFTQVFYLQ